MSASSPVAVNPITDHYRCAETFADFDFSRHLPSQPGYFRFGEGTICYGRTAAGFLRSNPNDDLYDVLPDIQSRGSAIALPFDPTEIIDNLRYERYAEAGEQRAVVSTLAGKAYY